MGELKDKMLMELELRNYSIRTIEAYIGQMVQFTRHYGKSPAEMGEVEIRQFLHYLKKVKGASISKINGAYCALKFFYVNVLHRDWPLEKLPRPKKEKRLPVVLSREEVKALLASVEKLKYKLALMTIYSAGLRISEAVNLKVTDIDSERMLVRVAQGKGRKDRYSLLAETLLKSLRPYFRTCRPTTWLFPGSKTGQKLRTENLARAFRAAKKKPESVSLQASTL